MTDPPRPGDARGRQSGSTEPKPGCWSRQDTDANPDAHGDSNRDTTRALDTDQIESVDPPQRRRRMHTRALDDHHADTLKTLDCVPDELRLDWAQLPLQPRRRIAILTFEDLDRDQSFGARVQTATILLGFILHGKAFPFRATAPGGDSRAGANFSLIRQRYSRNHAIASNPGKPGAKTLIVATTSWSGNRRSIGSGRVFDSEGRASKFVERCRPRDPHGRCGTRKRVARQNGGSASKLSVHF